MLGAKDLLPPTSSYITLQFLLLYPIYSIHCKQVKIYSPTRKKTLNHPIFIGNSRFFVDLHDNHTVQILMRTVRLCVHLSCNFSCEVFVLLLKTFTCLETNESLNCHVSSILFCYLLYVFSYCKVAVLNVYLV